MDEKQKSAFEAELHRLEELFSLSSKNTFKNGPAVAAVVQTAGLGQTLNLLCRILLAMVKE